MVQTELNGQSLEIIEKFFYLVNTRGARKSAVHSYVAIIRIGVDEVSSEISFVNQ